VTSVVKSSNETWENNSDYFFTFHYPRHKPLVPFLFLGANMEYEKEKVQRQTDIIGYKCL